MGYRAASPPGVKKLAYGRFGLSLLDALLLGVLGAIGVGALVASTRVEAFACDRSGGAVRCTHTTSLLSRVTGHRTFEGPALSSVELTPYTGNKQQEYGRIDLFDERGQPTSVLRGDRDDAREHYERLRRFLDDETAPRVRIEQRSGLLVTGLIALGAAIGCFFVLRTTWRRYGVIHFELDRARGTLAVITRRLLVLRSAREVPLEGVSRVDVRRGFIKRVFHGRHSHGDPAAQLWLRYAGGSDRPLTEANLAGTDVHEDAAAGLRAALDLAPEPRPVVAESAPIAAAPGARRKTLVPLLIGLSLVVAAVSVGFVLEHALPTSGARLVIRAEHRCRFGGMELLPTAEMEMQMPPGDHPIEVFDPNAPGGWRRETITVREGSDHVFVCR